MRLLAILALCPSLMAQVSVKGPISIKGPISVAPLPSWCVPGSLYCYSFDNQTDVETNHVYNAYSLTNYVYDTSAKATADSVASSKLTIPASVQETSGRINIDCSTDYSCQLGPGGASGINEWFVQWRQRVGPDWISHVYGGEAEGPKFFMHSGTATDASDTNPTSCDSLEVVGSNYYSLGFPIVYNRCGSYAGFYMQNGGANFLKQNGLQNCDTTSTAGCWTFVADQWMTFQLHMKLSNWYASDGNYYRTGALDLYAMKPGETHSTNIITVHDFDFARDPAYDGRTRWYGRFQATSQATGRCPAVFPVYRTTGGNPWTFSVSGGVVTATFSATNGTDNPDKLSGNNGACYLSGNTITVSGASNSAFNGTKTLSANTTDPFNKFQWTASAAEITAGSGFIAQGSGTIVDACNMATCGRDNYSGPATYIAWDNLVFSTTYIPDPDVTTPRPPTNLTVVAVSDTSTKLTWVNNSATGSNLSTGITVERCTGEVNACADSQSFSALVAGGCSSLAFNATTCTETGLTNSQKYTYRVKAVNASGDSAYSNMDANVPQPPSTLAATGGTGQVSLSWSQNGLSAEDQANASCKYGIYQCSGTCSIVKNSSTFASNFTRVKQVACSASSTVVSPLAAGTYTFVVRAENGSTQANWHRDWNQDGVSTMANGVSNVATANAN